MEKYKEIILNGLKELETLEKNLNTNKCYQYIDFHQHENHDDLLDHDDIDTEFDEILLPLDDDIFNKKEIDIKVLKSNNCLLLSIFPNALLLEEGSLFAKKAEKIEKAKPHNIDNDKSESEKGKDIWDILNEIKEENNSESLDSLTTESETDTPQKNKRVCKGCNSFDKLVEDHQTSTIICSECGMINEELFDHGPEWRQYNNDDNRGDGVNRCGCPSNFFFPKSSQGTIIAGISNSRLKRKQKWNMMVYKERSLNLVFEYITQICSDNNIPRIIIDSAKILYKRISDSKHKKGVNAGKQIIIRGENRLGIIAACVFKACEMNKNPRNIKEIAQFFKLNEKKITKGNKQFDKIIKNTDGGDVFLNQFNNDAAEDYIRRHCPRLKINKANTQVAVRIANNCCRMKLASDHNPQSIAAGAILVMAQYKGLPVDKKNIAKLFGTSDVTIGKIHNKITPYVDALVDDDATDHIIKKFKING